MELWCGDFFALQAEDVADCVALYDRAAVIALPPQMRAQYMALLSQALPAGAGLLVTLDYQQELLAGPPFSVADEEVRRGFANWQVEELEAQQVISDSPKFLQAGVTSLIERVYRVKF